MKEIKEKNKRTPFVNNYGMDAAKLKNSLKKRHSKEPKVVVGKKKRIGSSTHPTKRVRPESLSRKLKDTNPDLLLEVPAIGTKSSFIYQTPEWFQFKGQPEVSVIIPLYKSQDVIQDLINSWDFLNSGLKVEIIFVDDNCPYNTKDKIVHMWSHKKHRATNGIGKIIFNTENKGYGGACNTGAEYASGKYLIYLNADTRVTKNWIKPIVELFESDDNIGIIGNLQIKDGGPLHGTIDGAGSEWTWKKESFEHIGRHIYNGKGIDKPFTLSEAPEEILQVAEREMVTGCCLAIRSELNKQIGGFNLNFRVGYWEDSDICLTVREKGWKVMFQPKSKIYHKLGHTGSGSHSFNNFNRSFFWNKWVESRRIDPLVKDKRKISEEIKHILIQRKGANGDVLVASYVAGALKKKYPGVDITFSTLCPKVLEKHPYIDQVVSSNELSSRQFQLIYNLDMAYEYRPHTHIIESYADLVGVEPEDCLPVMAYKKQQILDDKYIVIHAGKTSWVGRDWGADKFKIIADRLMAIGKKVVLVGKHSDNEVPCHIDLRGQTSIIELAGIIYDASIFVGIDSLPFHIAQAVDTPGVCFFGSILPDTRIYRKNMFGINVDTLPCIGCHHRKPRPSVVTNICETKTHACEKELDIEKFWSKLNDLIISS